MFYGLDIHKAFLQICELAPDGERRRQFRVGASEEEIEAFAASLCTGDQVVLEATFHTWRIVQILRRHHHLLGRFDQEPGESDIIRLFLLEHLDQGLRQHLNTEIEHLETIIRQDNVHQIFADVMNVAFDGTDYHFADRFDARFGQQRSQNFHAALHRVCGEQHFRNE